MTKPLNIEESTDERLAKVSEYATKKLGKFVSKKLLANVMIREFPEEKIDKFLEKYAEILGKELKDEN